MHEATPDDKPKVTPWPITMFRGLISDRVPTRLGQDAFTLAMIIIDQQDRRFQQPVGFWREQLSGRCGFSLTCFRRLRKARQALIDDGWLECQIPKNGDRSEAVYKMITKKLDVSSDPGQSDSSGHVTRYKNDSGDRSQPSQDNPGDIATRVKSASLPESNRPTDPSQFDAISNPSDSNPQITLDINTSFNAHTPADAGERVDCFESNTDQKSERSQGMILESRSRRSKPSELATQAEAIYQAYPRKVAKTTAIKAIIKALKISSFDQLLDAVNAYRDAVNDWPDDEKRYIPYPATWFNAGRWEDDRATWQCKAKLDLFAGQRAFAANQVDTPRTLTGLQGIFYSPNMSEEELKKLVHTTDEELIAQFPDRIKAHNLMVIAREKWKAESPSRRATEQSDVPF